jgi:hypothetical protein
MESQDVSSSDADGLREAASCVRTWPDHSCARLHGSFYAIVALHSSCLILVLLAYAGVNVGPFLRLLIQLLRFILGQDAVS